MSMSSAGLQKYSLNLLARKKIIPPPPNFSKVTKKSLILAGYLNLNSKGSEGCKSNTLIN
jgi:hypothetical protein